MKSLPALFAIGLCLLLLPACKCCDDGDCGCQDQTNTAVEDVSCPGCAELMDGKTGWCADCGTGFNEGNEVNCKGECAGNPGGPPCAACVK